MVVLVGSYKNKEKRQINRLDFKLYRGVKSVGFFHDHLS